MLSVCNGTGFEDERIQWIWKVVWPGLSEDEKDRFLQATNWLLAESAQPDVLRNLIRNVRGAVDSQVASDNNTDFSTLTDQVNEECFGKVFFDDSREHSTECSNGRRPFIQAKSALIPKSKVAVRTSMQPRKGRDSFQWCHKQCS